MDDWVGPWYRDHRAQPAVGHLETAHLCWALAAALDLAAGAFSPGDRRELAGALGEKGIALCTRWLDRNTHLANWRGVMASGVAVAAAAIGDKASLKLAAAETLVCAQAFQPDGSYAESLQYANYLAYALMLAHEAVHAAAPDLEVAGGHSRPADAVVRPEHALLQTTGRLGWWAACPGGEFQRLRGGCSVPRATCSSRSPRCSVFHARRGRAGPVVVRHLLRPSPRSSPTTWPPSACATIGDFSRCRCSSKAAPPLSPAEAGLPTAAGFSNGNLFARDCWEGRTVLAAQGEAVHCTGRDTCTAT